MTDKEHKEKHLKLLDDIKWALYVNAFILLMIQILIAFT